MGKQIPWYTSYPFDIVVHGGWSEWSSYTDCSKTCDEGTKSRSRTCTRPVPSSGGSDCDGNASETMNCELKECVTGTSISIAAKTKDVTHKYFFQFYTLSH